MVPLNLVGDINGARQAHGDRLASSKSKHQVPHFGLGGSDFDFNVVTQPCQAVHQPAFGPATEVATHHVGYFGLGVAHAFGGFLLCQASAANGFPDLDHQAGLDLALVSVRQAKVGVHVARTPLPFNAIHQSSFHFRNAFANASATLSLAWMSSKSSFGAVMPRLRFFWKR